MPFDEPSSSSSPSPSLQVAIAMSSLSESSKSSSTDVGHSTLKSHEEFASGPYLALMSQRMAASQRDQTPLLVAIDSTREEVASVCAQRLSESKRQLLDKSTALEALEHTRQALRAEREKYENDCEQAILDRINSERRLFEAKSVEQAKAFLMHCSHGEAAQRRVKALRRQVDALLSELQHGIPSLVGQLDAREDASLRWKHKSETALMDSILRLEQLQRRSASLEEATMQKEQRIRQLQEQLSALRTEVAETEQNLEQSSKHKEQTEKEKENIESILKEVATTYRQEKMKFDAIAATRREQLNQQRHELDRVKAAIDRIKGQWKAANRASEDEWQELISFGATYGPKLNARSC